MLKFLFNSEGAQIFYFLKFISFDVSRIRMQSKIHLSVTKKLLMMTSKRRVVVLSYMSSIRVGDPFQIASNLLPNEEVSGYE